MKGKIKVPALAIPSEFGITVKGKVKSWSTPQVAGQAPAKNEKQSSIIMMQNAEGKTKQKKLGYTAV